MNDVKISGVQLSFLIIGFTFGTSAIMNSALVALQDGWLALLIAWAGGFLLMGVYVAISLSNKGKSFIGILEAAFGSLLGKVFGILYGFFFIHVGALVLRNYGQFMNIAVYTETPLIVLIASFSLIVAYTIRNGVEVLGRTSELLVPFIPIATTLVFFGVLSQMDISNFLPVLKDGIEPLLKGVFLTTAFPFSQNVVFIVLFNYLNKQENLIKVTMSSIAIVGSLLFLITIREIMVIGGELISILTYPAFLSAKSIWFIEVDPLIAINLMLGVFIKASVYLYCGIVTITEGLGLDDYKPLVLPLTAFTIALSIWVFESVFEFQSWVSDIFPYYSLIFQVLIPIVLLAVILIRKSLDR